MKRAFRCFLLLALLVFAVSGVGEPRGSSSYILFVGTYTHGGSKGIYAYRYSASSGKLMPLGLAAETVNPSFLAVHPSDRFLYAVNEIQNYKGESSGAVSAFAIDRRNGKLMLLNETASRGADPCYIAFDRTGKYALVANYTGGNVAIFPLSADGRIGDASSVLKDSGELGPNKDRQEAPHAHWIEATAHNRFAYVADLGLDRVLIYKFDAKEGTLSRGESRQTTASAGSSDTKDFFSATLAPGTGPRHVAFSADGNFMYVLGELDSTVTVLANDDKETFRAVQKISALPAGFSGHNAGAEVVIHPDGKFLYTSNRGDDSIAVFAIDYASGKLTFLQRIASGGKTPRNFTIDPTGRRLLVANQDSGDIVEFQIDAKTGKLTRAGEAVIVPSPVCLVFVAIE